MGGEEVDRFAWDGRGLCIVFDSAFGLITIAVNDFPRTQPTAF